MHADVVLAFGDRPGIPADDALELAEFLDRRGMARQFETASHSLAAVVLAAKIRDQARRLDAGEKSEDIDLDEYELNEYELIVLSQLLAVEPWPKSRPWFEHFQYEVNRHVGLASD
jgi:hypothetical protein